MNCPSGKKMTMMCTHEKCHASLGCVDEDCKKCTFQHSECKASGIMLVNVTNKVKEIDGLKAKCLEKVREIDGKCTLQLAQSQITLSTNPGFCNLSEKDSEVFVNIFMKEGQGNISGKEANRFNSSINAVNKDYFKAYPNIIL
jgi:hypothetical protein